MVWGAIGTSFRTSLTRCSNGKNSIEYLKIIEESGLIEKCNEIYGKHKWMFMQDGAPCHNSESTLKVLRKKMMIVPGWPPNSPDLNPIEIIWAIIKKKLKERIISKEDDLFKIVQNIWNALDENVINNLVKDFIRRCQLVLELGGGSISQ